MGIRHIYYEALENFAKGERSFFEYGLFKDIHVPLLVFQINATKTVIRDYNITRVDFIVLSAGYAIQKDSTFKCFGNPELKCLTPGVSHNVTFKSLDRLYRRGLIDLKEKRLNNRRFFITPKGFACISSFTMRFNLEVARYERESKPDFLKVGKVERWKPLSFEGS